MFMAGRPPAAGIWRVERSLVLGVGSGAAVARVARRRVVRWWNCILAGLGGEDVSFFGGDGKRIMDWDWVVTCVFLCGRSWEILCVVEIEEN